MNHLTSIKKLNQNDIKQIFDLAYEFKIYKNRYVNKNFWSDKLLTNLFYEPSTRTSSSFYSAMTRLGGKVLPINEVNFSSVVKGESLVDTIKTLQCYSDLIVLRHAQEGAAELAASVSNVPIINAGDGSGEHPTQALLDLFTILENFRSLENKKVVLMGDLKYGRTVHSLTYLLRMFGCKFVFVAPNELQIPNDFIYPGDVLTENLNEHYDCDILYITRVQKERLKKEKFNNYNLTIEDQQNLNSNCIIMHPLPRNEELPSFFDNDPRSKYFNQVENGLYVRMSIIHKLLNAPKI